MAKIFRCDWCGEIFDRQIVCVKGPEDEISEVDFKWHDDNRYGDSLGLPHKHICPKCLMEALEKSLEENK